MALAGGHARSTSTLPPSALTASLEPDAVRHVKSQPRACTPPARQNAKVSERPSQRYNIDQAGNGMVVSEVPKATEQAIPSRPKCGQEVFSAASMLAPSAYAAYYSSQVASQTDFPLGVWLVAFSTYCHCIASVAFHLQCAYKSGTPFDHFKSPFRCADMVLIHACTCSYGLALAKGDLRFSILNCSVNLLCASKLLWNLLLRAPGTKRDSHRVVGCIAVYTSAMVWRKDWINYACLMVSYFVGGIFWTRNEIFGGWGHGIFHLCLVPCIHFVMCSMAGL